MKAAAVRSCQAPSKLEDAHQWMVLAEAYSDLPLYTCTTTDTYVLHTVYIVLVGDVVVSTCAGRMGTGHGGGLGDGGQRVPGP